MSRGLFKKESGNSSVVRNSFWGIASNILQNLFISLFFVIITRQYLPVEIADFFVANSLYQLMAAFSAMGMGQWFIREYINGNNTVELTNRFLKIQVIFGIVFYLIAIVIVFVLYKNATIRILSVVFGINILFDNVIYGIKNLNIAEFKQQKTFLILIIDAFLRLLIGCVLFVYPISIVTLCIILVVIRFITLNLFLRMGTSKSLSIKLLLAYKVSWSDVKNLVKDNWAFVVIGSVSVVFWRIASIIISKMLKEVDIANYEISFRIFALAQIIPLITSASVYPMLIKKYENGGLAELKKVYRLLFVFYGLFGLLSYTFILSFSGQLIPFVFGPQYMNNPVFTQQMFLTMLLFPSVLLQANVIVALKHERMDMIFNIIVLLINTAGCIGGIYYFHSLSAVNYSIFFAFIIFHLMQDIFLIKQRVSSFKQVLLVYAGFAVLIFGYQYLNSMVNPFILFALFWMIIAGALYPLYKMYKSFMVHK
jgi:O-antigen/teichoic acid export membrane protein